MDQSLGHSRGLAWSQVQITRRKSAWKWSPYNLAAGLELNKETFWILFIPCWISANSVYGISIKVLFSFCFLWRMKLLFPFLREEKTIIPDSMPPATVAFPSVWFLHKSQCANSGVWQFTGRSRNGKGGSIWCHWKITEIQALALEWKLWKVFFIIIEF